MAGMALDPMTDALLMRARDLLAANSMWGWLLEVGRAGEPVTLSLVHDISEGVRAGDLPDLSLEMDEPVWPNRRYQTPSLMAART